MHLRIYTISYPARRLTSGLLLAWSLLAGTAQAQDWIDLTHDLSSDAVFWPTAEPFEMRTDFEGYTERGYYYSAYTFTTAEHGGTHIDAPVHFAAGKHSVNEIPLERLIGDAVVLDLRENVGGDCNYLLSISDIKGWEKAHGAIHEGAIVLLRTGFGKYWPDPKAYLGTELRGEAGAAKLCFPGLAPDAATWLAETRKISAVGIDTASIDRGKSRDFAAHVNLMTNNVPAFENLANLDQLPATGVYVVALPVKIRGGSGGPLRIVARVDGSP
jgi:kynurenine formamidase